MLRTRTRPRSVRSRGRLDYRNAAFQWYSSNDNGASWNAVSGATSATLNLSAAVAANRSWYKLVATDGARQSVAYAKPAVVDAPTALSVSVNADNLLVMNFNGVGDAQTYQVEYFLSDAQYPVWINMTQVSYATSGAAVTATHVNGANYVDYPIRVRALANDGWSDWAYVSGSHVDPTPLDAPTWKSSSSTHNSVTVAWNPVDNASGYVVEYKSSTDSGYTAMPKTTATTITIPGLAAETTYKLRVYAVGNGASYSDSAYSAIKAVKTKTAPVDATPLTAPTYKSSSSTPNSVTVAWNPVDNASGYVVEYKSSTDAGYTSMPKTTATAITIPNLAPDTTYKLRVYAAGDGTNYSDSAYSAVKAVKTKAAASAVLDEAFADFFEEKFFEEI